MFSLSCSMANSNRRAASTGAACAAMDRVELGGRALCVRLFVLFVAGAALGLLSLANVLLISRLKLLPLRIS